MSLQKEQLVKLDEIVKNTKNKKQNIDVEVLEMLIDVIKKLNDDIERLEINQETMAEDLSLIDKDIAGIQDDLFEEVTIEELEALDDEYVEVTCDKCNKQIYVEKSSVDEHKVIPCPHCGSKILS
jgi:DNA-directed RNA polymerase subunit RPC12/RpoP